MMAEQQKKKSAGEYRPALFHKGYFLNFCCLRTAIFYNNLHKDYNPGIG